MASAAASAHGVNFMCTLVVAGKRPAIAKTGARKAQIDEDREEPGADEVDALLTEGRASGGTGATEIVIPFIALMEVEYGLLRKYSLEQVDRVLQAIQAWPATIVESNPSWRRAAASIRARYRLSLADAWVASLAVIHDAELVHKDPEFDQIPALRAIRLPYNPGSG